MLLVCDIHASRAEIADRESICVDLILYTGGPYLVWFREFLGMVRFFYGYPFEIPNTRTQGSGKCFM